MVAKKDLRAGGASRTGAGEEAVATFLASMALDGSRSTKELGRPPTAFEIRVYKATAGIPCGKVATYGGLAAALGSSSRAVGQALRRNPFAPEVPCHRVVKTDRSIGGFHGTQGDTAMVKKKRAMLAKEGVDFSAAGAVDAGCVFQHAC
jgi:methylated-DNA-[protein]-cysteine S-methyltransferase